MGKPNIFFSHSSQDRIPLNQLKDIFLEKIGSTVNVFLSSDGQSIPFGKNWVKEVENALQDCKIMFVFLTPASIHSNWIYFEAGHAYSKGIKVIPVGFLGMDLNSVKPPLSLLQGFNIINEKGLDNIIAIINEEFDFQHKSLFTEEEYQKICSNSIFMKSHSLGEFGNYLEELNIVVHKINKEFLENWLDHGGGANDIVINHSKYFQCLNDFFDSHKIEYSFDGMNYYLRGISIYLITKNIHNISRDVISIRMDPFFLEKNSDLIREIIEKLKDDGVKGTNFNFTPAHGIYCLTEWHSITGKLEDDSIKLARHEQALYYDALFIKIYREDYF